MISRVRLNVSGLDAGYLAAVETIVRDEAFRIEAEVKLSIRARQSKYRPYKRGKGGKRVHWSSAPGQPPNQDRGNLAGRIYTKRTTKGGDISYEVRAPAAYAVPLEIGTKRMAARPFMGPVARRIFPEVEKAVIDYVRKWRWP